MPERASDELALLLHTSGTTSRPKLVPLTHANLAVSARNIGATLELTPVDRCLNVMPLFHVHGLVASLLASLAAGGSVTCTPGFHPLRMLDWLGESDPTWYTAVPTMHQALLARIDGKPEPPARLRFIRSSSAALPRPVLEGLERTFGVPVVEAYGMTEAAHQMASNPPTLAGRRPGSVGPAAGPEIAILSATGEELPAGALGEVAIRGANVFSGYERNPEANREAFTNGWFRTGDEGTLDEDGYLTLQGRIKELINRGGEKISPAEIDERLLAHPAVAEAVAFALPDERLGEEVGAAVVLAAGHDAGERELQEFVAETLAPFKVPRRIVVVDEIPKGPTGKLQRIGLAERLELRSPNVGSDGHAGPRSLFERSIAEVFAQVLDIPSPGIDDDFFALGGDSILGAEAVARLREVTGQELPLRLDRPLPDRAWDDGRARHGDGARALGPDPPRARAEPASLLRARRRRRGAPVRRARARPPRHTGLLRDPGPRRRRRRAAGREHRGDGLGLRRAHPGRPAGRAPTRWAASASAPRLPSRWRISSAPPANMPRSSSSTRGCPDRPIRGTSSGSPGAGRATAAHRGRARPRRGTTDAATPGQGVPPILQALAAIRERYRARPLEVPALVILGDQHDRYSIPAWHVQRTLPASRTVRLPLTHGDLLRPAGAALVARCDRERRIDRSVSDGSARRLARTAEPRRRGQSPLTGGLIRPREQSPSGEGERRSGGLPWPHPPEAGDQGLEIRLGHRPLADLLEAPGPRAQRQAAWAAVEQRIDRLLGRGPEPRELECRRLPAKLSPIGGGRHRRDVGEVPQRPERPVLPGVNGEDDGVIHGVGRHETRDEAGDARLEERPRLDRREPCGPVEPGMHLDRERKPGPEESPQMVVARGSLRASLDEPRVTERPVNLVGPRRQQVDVAEATGRPGIQARDLRPLEEQERPLAARPDPLEQQRRACVRDRRDPCLILQLRRNRPASSVQGKGGKRGEPVSEDPLRARECKPVFEVPPERSRPGCG